MHQGKPQPAAWDCLDLRLQICRCRGTCAAAARIRAILARDGAARHRCPHHCQLCCPIMPLARLRYALSKVLRCPSAACIGPAPDSLMHTHLMAPLQQCQTGARVQCRLKASLDCALRLNILIPQLTCCLQSFVLEAECKLLRFQKCDLSSCLTFCL